MKKIVIWPIGLVLSFLSGVFMWGSWSTSIDELGKTVDNISIASLGGIIICSLGIGFCFILHLIILFQAIKYFKYSKLSIHDFFLSSENTLRIKTLKIIGYIITLFLLFDLLSNLIYYSSKGNIYEIISVFFAIIVTALILIWISAVSKYWPRKKPIKLLIIACVCLLTAGPVLLFPLIGRLLVFLSDKLFIS